MQTIEPAIGELTVEEKLNTLKNQARSELHSIFSASIGITNSIKSTYPNIPEAEEFEFEKETQEIIGAIGRLKQIRSAIKTLEREA